MPPSGDRPGPDRAVRAGVRTLAGMSFPQQRLRRLRRTPALRRLVAETRLAVDDLVAPLFVREGIDEPQPISSLPGRRPAHPRLAAQGGRAAGRPRASPPSSCSASPSTRTPRAPGACDPDGIVQVALRDLRDDVGDEVVLMADLCLDEYTDHGHCGLLTADGEVDNDATLDRYAEVALAQAEAGVDVVAPSGMMDGQVAAIRDALDEDGLRAGGDPGLRRQVRLGAVRPVPRGGRRRDRRRRRPQGATSRTPPTPARRWRRSGPTSPRAPTW